MKVVVLGAGAWGSTLADLLVENGHDVQVWSRRSNLDLSTIAGSADVLLSAVSMKGVRALSEQIPMLKPTCIILSATKGLDAPDSPTALPCLPSQIWQAAFPQNPVTVLSGPNLSQEIADRQPAASVIGGADPAVDIVQQLFASRRFRVYTNGDRLGVELGGTLKNVMAIAVGACDGLNLGTNAKSALVTRGLAEMIRLGIHWGAKPETFYGLSGLGDLMATCSSALSRNYQVGYGLAQGRTLAEVMAALKGTAEGVNTTEVLLTVADRQGIELPIATQVSRLLRGQVTPQMALEELMRRDSKAEI
ncbi:MAG: NAD(P)H-dependent glycerol-3-phosphate dehydrogenase [Alkalinema sp. RU_4_3]|nr:NAD(P)H-dependent glycerol-3-phosphate dehydrogenase [Alkalinema sp. RU_4_3]